MSVQPFFSDLHRGSGGIKVMSNAVQEQYEAFLGPLQKVVEPARKRLEKSSEPGRRVDDFIEGSHDTSSLHVAWWLASKCLNGSLAYDIRISGATCSGPLLEEHAEVLKVVVNRLLGKTADDITWRRFQLSGPLGKFSLRLPKTSAHAARVAF